MHKGFVGTVIIQEVELKRHEIVNILIVNYMLKVFVKLVTYEFSNIKKQQNLYKKLAN